MGKAKSEKCRMAASELKKKIIMIGELCNLEVLVFGKVLISLF